MIIDTRDFGQVEIQESDVLTMEEPLLGFEDYHRYVLLLEESLGEQFGWLQSLEDKELCFILMRADAVNKGYAPVLPGRLRQVLGQGDCEYWLVMVLGEQLWDSTVNLKSPVVINHQTGKAVQFVADENWPIRFSLGQTAGEGE